jgi:hypothetical protein
VKPVDPSTGTLAAALRYPGPVCHSNADTGAESRVQMNAISQTDLSRESDRRHSRARGKLRWLERGRMESSSGRRCSRSIPFESLQPGRNDCVARSPKGDSATVGQASSLSRTASRGPPCSVQASNARRRECSSRACRVRDRLEARPTASFRLSWAIDTGTSTTRRGIYASGTAGHRTSIPFPARTCHTKKETGNRFPVSRVI